MSVVITEGSKIDISYAYVRKSSFTLKVTLKNTGETSKFIINIWYFDGDWKTGIGNWKLISSTPITLSPGTSQTFGITTSIPRYGRTLISVTVTDDPVTKKLAEISGVWIGVV